MRSDVLKMSAIWPKDCVHGFMRACICDLCLLCKCVGLNLVSASTGSKASPGTGNAEAEQEPGAAAGRKRRWGSSTAVTAKKPSISITTDSLKVLTAFS